MTEEQIVKALECSPLDDIGGCRKIDALDLINRQKAGIEFREMEIKSLESERNELYKVVAEKKAEVEELKTDKIIAERKEKDARDLFKDAVIQLDKCKAEIERLRNECGNQSALWSQHFESLFETSKEAIRAEAIKEFAERLPELIPNINGEATMECVERAIKHTLKGTVGEADD